MRRHRLFLLALALPILALCACTHMGIHEERIRVRRAPEIVERDEQRVRPGDYEQYLRDMQDEADRLRLTPELKREEALRIVTRHRVGSVMGSIPEDPWASYEKDRLDTLHRNWADAKLPPPPPEKEVLEEAKAAEEDEEEEGGEGDDAGDEDEGDEDEDDGFDDDDEEWDDE